MRLSVMDATLICHKLYDIARFPGVLWQIHPTDNNTENKHKDTILYISKTK